MMNCKPPCLEPADRKSKGRKSALKKLLLGVCDISADCSKHDTDTYTLVAQEKAEEDARLAAQESAATIGDSLMADVKKEEDDESGLVFDDTTEFVRAIQYDPTAKPEPKKPQPIAITIRTARSPSAGPGDEAVTEMDVDANGVHDDEDSGNENEDEVLNIIANAIAESSAQAESVKPEQDDDEVSFKACLVLLSRLNTNLFVAWHQNGDVRLWFGWHPQYPSQTRHRWKGFRRRQGTGGSPKGT